MLGGIYEKSKTPNGPTVYRSDRSFFPHLPQSMEELVGKGLVKAVGISNFTITKTERLLQTAKIVPAVNQVECHPYLQQQKLKEYSDSKGNYTLIHVAVIALTPLTMLRGGGGGTIGFLPPPQNFKLNVFLILKYFSFPFWAPRSNLRALKFQKTSWEACTQTQCYFTCSILPTTSYTEYFLLLHVGQRIGKHMHVFFKRTKYSGQWRVWERN